MPTPNVRVEDLDLEAGFIRFRDRRGGTETVNPVDQETVSLLQRLLAVGRIETGYVFRKTGNKPMQREQVRRKVREAAVRAGVMDEVDEKRWHYKFTPHYYRTIFTSLLRNAEMPDHYTRYLRGDSDKEVMDLYTNIPREQVREAYLARMKPLNV
ncbi:tyrosine-type recombinase/integrase [Haladaptatus sp. NG-WS-4]